MNCCGRVGWGGVPLVGENRSLPICVSRGVNRDLTKTIRASGKGSAAGVSLPAADIVQQGSRKGKGGTLGCACTGKAGFWRRVWMLFAVRHPEAASAAEGSVTDGYG